MKKFLLIVIALSLSIGAFAQAPVVMFTDLTSGPNTGGENGNGTILTIYGKSFGTSGTVTIGGVQPVKVFTTPAWGTTVPGGVGLQKISVQLGSGISGSNLPIVVTVGGVASSCGNPTAANCQFTVRPGNIWCVSTSGNDSNAGTFPSSCWATPTQATQAMSAGDITYFINNYSYNGGNPFCGQYTFSSCNFGTAAAPFAFVGYPGEPATMGSLISADNGGIATYGDWITVANMNAWTSGGGSSMHMSNEANNQGGQGIRLIDIDVECPNGNTDDGCWDTGSGISGAYMSGTSSSWDYVYGIRVYNVSSNVPITTKFWHGVYIADGTKYTEVGYSAIYNSNGNRGIQIYTSSVDIVGIIIHDSLIHDIAGDCLLIGSVDVSAPTQFYNNVLYNCGIGTFGTGGLFVEGESPYDGIQAGASPSGNGTIQFYNNTMYNCGAEDPTNGACLDLGGTVDLTYYNNIVYVLSTYTCANTCQSPGTPETYYLAADGDIGILVGSDNLWYGQGNGPSTGSSLTGNVNANPNFVATGSNFNLASNSPAIGAGSTTLVPKYDFNGVLRPNPPSIGAYELSGVSLPNPPTNLQVTVQ